MRATRASSRPRSRRGGSLDALVCAAGIPSGPWDSREHWDDVIRIDLTAPYEALRVCWPALVTARGSAVLVGSIVGAVEGSLRSPAYAAAKAGLEGVARSFAVIGGPDGVRVNVVAPGAIATDFDERLLPVDQRTDVPLAGWEPPRRWRPSSASWSTRRPPTSPERSGPSMAAEPRSRRLIPRG